MKPQNIIITGGASGLGLELAQRYARQGANIALLDLTKAEKALDTVKQACRSSTQQVELLSVDISQFNDVKRVVAKAVNIMGSPDIVINCAGINNACGIFDQIDHNSFENVVKVNLFGSRNIAEAVLPYMKGRQSKIVFIASLAGIVGNYGYAPYCASKFGVMGLANCLRIELKPHNIEVQVVCPPEIDTPMVHDEHKTIHPTTLKLKLMAGALGLEEAIDGIMKGLNTKRFLIIPGKLAKFTYYLSRFAPSFVTHGVVDLIVARTSRS
jgi:3-dehydrosphinganine reductase